MPVAKKLNVAEAVAYAKSKGISLSPPSVIKHSASYGYQLGGKGGKWVIDKTDFKRWLDGKK